MMSDSSPVTGFVGMGKIHSSTVPVAKVSKEKSAKCTTSLCFVAEVGEKPGPSFGDTKEKTDFHS